MATVRFEHAGVTVEQEFDLGLVIPGARDVFADLGVPFDEVFHLRALDYLTGVMQQGVIDGAIMNPPGVL